MENRNKNNEVKISGVIKGDARYKFARNGEQFYEAFLSCKRDSGIEDVVSILYSGMITGAEDIKDGVSVFLTGQYRSKNKTENGKSRLLLSVFVTEIEINPSRNFKRDYNRIKVNGFLCKEPVYRTTPLGREITDLLIAINRPFHKTDYIPCICWGRTAVYVANHFKVGDPISFVGRIQSRNYEKNTEDGPVVKTTYEVSIMKLIESEKNKDKEG